MEKEFSKSEDEKSLVVKTTKEPEVVERNISIEWVEIRKTELNNIIAKANEELAELQVYEDKIVELGVKPKDIEGSGLEAAELPK